MVKENNFENFEKKIGIEFKDKNLLQLAFIHRSFINENEKWKEHNERIEFLGDAVLELAMTKFLYNKFPRESEGVLTAYRSAMVNTESLSRVAKKLNLNDFLLMSKGEKSSTKGRDHILANTFEALIGAIYLDQGFEKAESFLEKYLFDFIDEVVSKKLHKDPKSYFQEQAQEYVRITPEYKLVKYEGPDHDRVFVMAVYLGEEKVAEGRGSSKQKAEISAARNGLEVKKWL